MQLKFLLFIVVSAFFHAFYNYLMKKSGGCRQFLSAMFLAASVMAALASAVGGNFSAASWSSIPWHSVPYVFGASIFYFLYQAFASRAYESGRISAMYPLTVLSPILIPFWAFLALDERISVMSAIGILLSISGAIMVKLNEFSFFELKKMFQMNEDYRAARYALGASLMYSIGAVLDKFRISDFPLEIYLALLLPFMAFNMVAFSGYASIRSMPKYFMDNRYRIVLGGAAVFLSFLFFRIVLRVADVSIVVPLRQISIVFAILLGVIMLQESIRPVKVVSSLMIIAGVALVNAGFRH